MNQTMQILLVDPTVFFIDDKDALRRRILVKLKNTGEPRLSELSVAIDGSGESFELSLVPVGESSHEIFVPDIDSAADAVFTLSTANGVQHEMTVRIEPQRHWEVYLVHYAHHDMGYTDLPSRVKEEYNGFMDQVLSFCAETESWPEEDARFHYQCEQAFSAVHYVESRPKEIVDRMMHFVQSGQIEITALFGNQTLELCSHEEMIRLLYPSFELRRKYGINISSAEHNDIPGFPWGLASALAGAGVRYFSPGIPLWYFSGVHPLWDTEKALPLGIPAACWWQGPDGARLLLWSDIHGREWEPFDYSQAVAELPGMLQNLESKSYPYDMVSYTLRGGHRDNAPPSIRYAYMVREWNHRWAYPRLINTTNTPFLENFEKRWGGTLPTLRGDVPGTDYPVAATCTPGETATDRTTHELLMSAEKTATVASIVAGYEYPRGMIDEAYRETFYYDLHCWGLSDVGGPAQDAHVSEKTNFAFRAAALAHDVSVKAANRIVDNIGYPENDTYITVFNTLADNGTYVVRVPGRSWGPCGSPMHRSQEEGGKWPLFISGRAVGRSIVDLPADLFEKPFAIVDESTGKNVEYQISKIDNPRAAARWAPERFALGKTDPLHIREIVFAAESVPSMGYKTYRIIRGKSGIVQDDQSRFPATDRKIENRFFTLELDPKTGGVKSLFDKDLSRELLDEPAPHSFACLLARDSGTAEEERMRVTDTVVAESGPLFTTLRINGELSCCPRITMELTLQHSVKRIDVSFRILRDSTPMRELYVAFPFLIESPNFRFESTGSVIEPVRDQWPGSCTDYYAVQHWVDVYNDDYGVTWTPLDTPMAELGGLWPGYVSGAHHGARGPEYGHEFHGLEELKKGHIYSMVSYNNFRTNFVNAHPSEFVVRYSFTSGERRNGEAAAPAHRFGWQVANPPLPVCMTGGGDTGAKGAPGTLPLESSFCRIDAENAAVLTFKVAEDNNGYIIRIKETEGRSAKVTAEFPDLLINEAFETNLVEEDERSIDCDAHSFQVALNPHSVKTIRFYGTFRPHREKVG